MIAYREEKINNAICYFAKAHRKATKKYLSQTFLYKYLAFLEFKSIEELGKPVFGLKYKAMERGPVPIEIYSKRRGYKTDLFYFKEIGNEKIIVVPRDRKANLDYFSQWEINEMERLIAIYADKFVSANDISDASHQAIKAWKKAFKIKPNTFIDYDLCFDDINKKSDEDLSYIEDQYLVYKALENTQKGKS
ncbi:MAG: Panacea domain-containing protein [Spirochaetota bacterium]